MDKKILFYIFERSGIKEWTIFLGEVARITGRSSRQVTRWLKSDRVPDDAVKKLRKHFAFRDENSHMREMIEDYINSSYGVAITRNAEFEFVNENFADMVGAPRHFITDNKKWPQFFEECKGVNLNAYNRAILDDELAERFGAINIEAGKWPMDAGFFLQMNANAVLAKLALAEEVETEGRNRDQNHNQTQVNQG